ncbi:hypothetical protein [Paenirhodobacter populi]|uniref:hypothetical protein n=1 Tax=Paenirhodobacter populi TaxID=2306993 RepID=UPI0019D4DFB7|nr:hypothetical protein [Sinirhodobacter populi]
MKVGKQIRGIIEAIKAGMFHESMKGEMMALEARKKELAELLAGVPDDGPDILPSASAVYAKKVAVLTGALARPDERPQTAEALRMLIEKIVLTPGPERGKSTPHCMANCGRSSNGPIGKLLERRPKRQNPRGYPRACLKR